MSAKKRLGVLVATTGTALALSGLLAGTASALTYDGQDPEASGCSSSAITAEQHALTYNGATIGWVQLRYSTSCMTVWSRIETTNSAWAKGDAEVVRNSPEASQGWGWPGKAVPWSSGNSAYSAWTPMLNDVDATSYANGCLINAADDEVCSSTSSY